MNNRYYVVVTRTEKGFVEEFTELVTNDIEVAKQEARKQVDLCSREESKSRHYEVEIRDYINDVEDERCENFDYNPIEF